MKKCLISVFGGLLLLVGSSNLMADYDSCGPCYDPCYRPCEPLCDSLFSGWYAAASVSLGWHRNTDIGEIPTSHVDHCMLWGGNLALGYMIEEWRLEFEGLYKYGKNDCLQVDGVGTVNDAGHISNFGLLWNLYYDMPVTDPFTVYLGAGLGMNYITLELCNTLRSADDCALVFAWQILAGMAWDLSDCWAVTMGYRFLSSTKPTLKIRAGGVTSARTLCDAPFSNNVDLGLRLKF